MTYVGHVVSVSSKGQVVIPSSIRSELGIAQGDRLELRVVDGALLLRRAIGLDELTALAQSWVDPEIEPITDASQFYQQHREQPWR